MSNSRRMQRLRNALQRIRVAYGVELIKAIRLRQTYVGPALLFLMVILSPLAHPLRQDTMGDYAFIAYVTPLALNFLGYVLLLTYVGGLIATEMDRGTLRMVLLRPIHRCEIYLAKLLLGCSYSLLLTLVVGLSSWGMVMTFGDLYGVQVGGVLRYTSDEMLWAYLGGALLVLLPQWAGVSLGLLFSSLTRSTGTAVSLSVGTWIALDLIKYPLGIDHLVFSTYLESPWHVFISQCDGLDGRWFPMAGYAVVTSAVVALGTTALGLFLFSRRNLGSCG